MEPLDVPVAPGAVLREPAHRVSRRAVLMWTMQALVVLALLLAAQVVWWLVDDAPSRTPHWVVGAVWLVAGAAYAVAMPQWRYRVHRWEATPRAIYTQSGWLWQERRIAPLGRVQTVDLERGPVAQLLGLAAVTITTASAAGPVTIHGLDLPVAHELVDALTAAAVAETGDAT
ncbi:PH domain-containing protein [Terrabacter sp. Ter38]|uniref:PH domain-containing protein n=1 Tax=Terrabacter sp. Ter38 TaxID=2926030 RepID=UPI002117687F|nr:PH domain-containing protein [Terrabacter sp. Ter38]